MKTYGIAFIGLDHWYNGFPMLEAIHSNPKVQLRWVADSNQDKVKTIAEKFRALRSTSNYEDALNDPEVQIITCFCSIDQSAELCIAAAQAGKHIISIKPMAMNLDEADKVVKAVKRSNVKYFPGGASHAFFASHQAYKKWVEDGRIGEVKYASGSFHAGLPIDWPDSSQSGWFVDPLRVPGGAWIDHAIFYIHTFSRILHSKVVRVEGVTANLKYTGLNVGDFGQSIFSFANGAIVSITATWLAANKAERQSLEFYGTHGSITWDTLLNKVAITGQFDGAEKGWTVIDRPADLNTRATLMIEHIIECINEDKTPICTVDDDRASLGVALAFYEAAKTHTAIDLTL